MKPEDYYTRYKSYKNIDEGHRATIEETLTYISYNAWLKGLNDGILRGQDKATERILGLRKEIINCVINYGLMPEQYERVMNDIEKVIIGETE